MTSEPTNRQPVDELVEREFEGHYSGDVEKIKIFARKLVTQTHLDLLREVLQEVVGVDEPMIGYNDMDIALQDFVDRTAFQRNKLRAELRTKLSHIITRVEEAAK